MTAIVLENFSGVLPRRDPSLLANNQAAIAVDCDFSQGGVAGLPAATTVSAYTAASNIKSGFVFSSADGSEQAFDWGYDVDAVRGPVAQDDFNRFYWTGVSNGTREFRFASANENTANPGRVTKSYKVGVIASTGWNKTWSQAGFSHDVVRKPPSVSYGSLTNASFTTEITDPSGQSFQTIPPESVTVTGVGAATNGWHGEYTLTLPKSLAEFGKVLVATVNYEQRAANVQVSSAKYSARFQATVFSVGGEVRFVALNHPVNYAFPEGVTVGSSVKVMEVTQESRKTGSWDDDTTEMVDVLTPLGTGSLFARTPTSLSSSTADIPPGLTTAMNPFPTDAKLKITFAFDYQGAKHSVEAIDGGDGGTINIGDGIVVKLSKVTDTAYKITLTFGKNSVPEATAYLFTVVNKFGEESEPSLPVEVTFAPQSQAFKLGINLVVMNALVDGAGLIADRAEIRGIRMYRTSAGLTSAANYYYVGTLRVGGTANPVLAGERYLTVDDSTPGWWYWTDTVAAAELSTVLTTGDYISDTAELQGLQGLIGIHNGMLAAFKENEVWVCESYAPWAWKRAAVHTLPHKPVALQQHEQGFLALTELVPYYFSGTSPADMLPTRLNAELPCVEKNAVTSIGGVAVYLSQDGPVFVQGATAKLDQTAFNRESFRREYAALAASGGGVRLVSYGHKALMYLPGATGSVGGYLFDFDTQSWTKFSGKMTFAMHVPANSFDLVHDSLAFADGNQWKLFNASEVTTQGWTWESKTFVLPKPTNFGAMQLFGVGVVTLEVYADGALKSTQAVTMTREGAIVRLPSGFMATRWSFRFKATSAGVSMTRAVIANSMQEIANA